MQIPSPYPDKPQEELIHALWDRLADFDAAQVDAALIFLLEGLCELVSAQNADWIGVVRLADTNGDPAHGWRPPVVRFLCPTAKLVAAVKEQTRRIEQKQIHPVAEKMFDMAGRFRACRLCDLLPPSWFGEAFYRSYYVDNGHVDAVYIAVPVNEDAESYFGVFRASGCPPFTERERDLLAYALRGIKWFHRRLLLSHGLLIAETALTPAERQVLKSLLTGQTEKQIAAELGQSHHTTHGHVASIYRKFGVSNRPALTALWLGRTERNLSQPPK